MFCQWLNKEAIRLLLTVQFCSRVNGIGISGHDHEPGLPGDLNEEIMNLLEVWLRHFEM
jgi:hypothetical protein